MCKWVVVAEGLAALGKLRLTVKSPGVRQEPHHALSLQPEEARASLTNESELGKLPPTTAESTAQCCVGDAGGVRREQGRQREALPHRTILQTQGKMHQESHIRKTVSEITNWS